MKFTERPSRSWNVTRRWYYFLTVEQVEQGIYELASELYPDYPDPMPTFQYIGQEGKGRLESALAEPRQTFGGLYLHRTVFDKAAALFRSIVLNHALVDGNKRLGLATVTVFLTLNGYFFYTRREDAVAFALRVASPDDRPSLAEISRWLRRHSIRIEAFMHMNRGAQLGWFGIERQTEPYRTERLGMLRSWARSIGRMLRRVGSMD